jgi:hypothetical protein
MRSPADMHTFDLPTPKLGPTPMQLLMHHLYRLPGQKALDMDYVQMTGKRYTQNTPSAAHYRGETERQGKHPNHKA